eukprot:CAMPEP_0182471922 /NCGR_PEP_ID=MMETSP1319-20130603/21236_1 /TAXON_ID=172717 /ORGANISM="Bolidomonas pacifica, Strain RCC208" /LENGTH=92 /DNA_ID=CAMNT_0024672533 /DNA_START=105 /DNA_END=383 /DNA_ORIENTATION=+
MVKDFFANKLPKVIGSGSPLISSSSKPTMQLSDMAAVSTCCHLFKTVMAPMLRRTLFLASSKSTESLSPPLGRGVDFDLENRLSMDEDAGPL